MKATGSADMSELAWTGYNVTTDHVFRAELNDAAEATNPSYSRVPECLCTTYNAKSNNSISSMKSYDKQCCLRAITPTQVMLCNSGYSSSADFKAEVSGTLIYPVTPTITTLDPIELPVLPSKHATVWSDPTANLKLTYVIDSETIEESLESGIGKAFSSVAPVETSPATDSHGVGSRIVYNETLYKVTSAIAAGEDIVPGTNVTATTVAAELLATQA